MSTRKIRVQFKKKTKRGFDEAGERYPHAVITQWLVLFGDCRVMESGETELTAATDETKRSEHRGDQRLLSHNRSTQELIAATAFQLDGTARRPTNDS